MFKKILWATDFTEHARHAGQRALQCAQCSDAILYALTVVDPEELPEILEHIPDPFGSQEEEEQLEWRLEQEHQRRVLDQLDREVQSVRDDGATVKTLLRIGVPWRQIVRTAEDLGVTLIVIGSHAKRTLEDVLLGGTVDNVTKRATCPVLIVR